MSATPSTSAGPFTRESFETRLLAWASAPAWWIDRKRRAFEQYCALPLPRRGDESWRFSNVAGLKLPEALEAVGPGARTVLDGSGRTAPGFSPAASLQFLDGALEALGEPAPDLAARGVVVSTLSSALRTHPDLLKEHFMAQAQRLGSDKFAALHIAFLDDGAFIHVPKGVRIPAPVSVLHRASGGRPLFPHTLVLAEAGAEVTVLEVFQSPRTPGEGSGGANAAGTASAGGPAAGPALVVGANDLYAGHGAQLNYVGVQEWSASTLAIQLNSIVVRRDASVQSMNLHLGGRQARHESLSQLQAPGAFSEMLALSIAGGEQEFDQRTLQIHQAPNTRSDLLYKNALMDRARTIFSGLIVVDPDAQRTDAYQSNRNLMLSDDAEANSLPGLEIQANDVRCTHGATTSRIDAEQEFYLRSRGIPKALADELLVFGFFEDVIGRLKSETLRQELRTLIQARFKRRNA